MTKTLKKSDYEALAAFRFALRRFLRFSEVEAERAGLTPQQYQAMVVIKGFPSQDPVTVGDLADHLLIRHHSAVGLVDRLVAQGLVKREVSQEDRRLVYIFLTCEGEQILDQLAALHREELRLVGRSLAQSLEELVNANAGEVKATPGNG